MSNQEAIASLKTLCHNCKLFPKYAYEKPECFKAIEMAISALQAQDLQPTCNKLATDTISRQAAIDAIKTSRYLVDAMEKVIKLPSAQPEIIRCKECCHRIENNHYGERGYLKIKGYCELDTGDLFELGRDAGNDDWFCADAERRTDEGD